MSNKTVTQPETEYQKAQKQRNLMIGLSLFAFVALVFFISLSKTITAEKAGKPHMLSGMKR